MLLLDVVLPNHSCWLRFTTSYCAFSPSSNFISILIASKAKTFWCRLRFASSSRYECWSFDENENILCFWKVIYAWFTFFFLLYLHMHRIKSKHFTQFFCLYRPFSLQSYRLRRTRGAQGYSVTVYWLNMKGDYMYIIYEYEQSMHLSLIYIHFNFDSFFFGTFHF